MTTTETVTEALVEVHAAEVTLMACDPCDVAGMVAHEQLTRALTVLSAARTRKV
jgi:hypothetical protein